MTFQLKATGMDHAGGGASPGAKRPKTGAGPAPVDMSRPPGGLNTKAKP